MFGLVGEKLSHSYSKLIHNEFGRYNYELFPVEKDKFSDFIKSKSYDGLNVTIPYKKAVMPFCNELSDAAKAIGSVNTVKVKKDGSLFGDNTDYYGFLYLAERTGIDFKNKKVLVLGSGGTSLTVCKAVSDKGGNPIVISRTGKDNYENISKHFDADIIVNTTPVGMFPNTETAPVNISGFKSLCGVLDVIYNPMRTRIVQQAQERNINASCGLPMLVAQAAKSCEIFSDTVLETDIIEKVILKLQKQIQNIVLIGMPGSGKSTIGKMISKKLDMKFVDIDLEIVNREGKSILEIFDESGEKGFRIIEKDVTAEISKKGGQVISAGGGTPLFEENIKNLRQNSLVVYLLRDIAKLPTDGRPLSQNQNLFKMLKERLPYYLKCADITVDNNANPQSCVKKILEAYDENPCDKRS